VAEQSLQPKVGRSVILSALIFCAAAAPVIFLTLLVLRYGVSIPVLDDWEMVPLVTRAHQGTLKFEHLFAQQQEAHTFFPRLLFILFALKHPWDGRIEMILSILICCLTALGIYFLLRKSDLSAIAAAGALLTAVLLIFSPVQEELWLLASGFPSFVPALCVVCGLLVIRTSVGIAAKFWLCLALAILSSFTLANGLLAWGLTFPVLFATQRVPTWKRWLGGWFLACAVCAAIYFWHFQARPDLPQFAPRKSPFEYLGYLLAFLGSGLARSGTEYPLGASIAVGAIILLAYLGVLGYYALHCRDREQWSRILPWIALGGYSIGSGCLAALGRIEWGVRQALESRYVPFSLYLTVTMIALVAICAAEVLKARPGSATRRVILAVVVFLGAGYLTLELMAATASIALFRLRSAAYRLGNGAVLFSSVLDTSKTITSVNHPRPLFVREYADLLDRLHLLRTPLVRTKEINKLRHTDADGHSASGWFDGLAVSDQSNFTAWGWAALPGKGRPADCVILAYANERGEWIAFGLSDAVLKRPDVAQSLRDPEQLWTGWRTTLPRSLVPKGAKLSAWAVDAKDAKLYRLKENNPLPSL
jgi:hypothetical protein